MNNDLISRDALKAEVALMFGDKTHITESVCELIDNAPTVDTYTLEDLEKAKNNGYKWGKIDGKKERQLPHESEIIKAYSKGFDAGVETVKNERSQGEWIEVYRSEITHNMAGEVLTFYRCSKCDRTLSIYPSMLTDYPFCHCGADMRGAE